MTPSALARRAGCDATTFNPSKRTSPEGRDRWPSTETLAKILNAASMDLVAFGELINSLPEDSTSPKRRAKKTEIQG
ncbi:hypothetical protein [Microvirga roseola]|uniref:hypothetical protein n=1 Tax=Microvirga roseola TaxID=2883126 RepID=UPI002AC33C62|nr:hypothetical protein [Microvirga roseola]